MKKKLIDNKMFMEDLSKIIDTPSELQRIRS